MDNRGRWMMEEQDREKLYEVRFDESEETDIYTLALDGARPIGAKPVYVSGWDGGRAQGQLLYRTGTEVVPQASYYMGLGLKQGPKPATIWNWD